MRYTKKVVEKYLKKTDAHWFGLYPAVINSLGDMRGKSVLDIGCGTGELSKYLSEAGAIVTAIDNSKNAINYAKSKDSKTNYLVADAINLKFKQESFDIVIMNMVLMHFDNNQFLDKTIFNACNTIRNGGLFVFSDLHPICKMTQEMMHRKMIYKPGFSYFRDGSKYNAVVNLDGDLITFHNTHWTIPTLMNIIQKNGICLKSIIEPAYDSKAPKKLRAFPYPEYIIFVGRKIL